MKGLLIFMVISLLALLREAAADGAGAGGGARGGLGIGAGAGAGAGVGDSKLTRRARQIPSLPEGLPVPPGLPSGIPGMS